MPQCTLLVLLAPRALRARLACLNLATRADRVCTVQSKRTLLTLIRAHCCLVEALLAGRARHAGRIGALLALTTLTAFLLSPLALRPDPFVARGTFHEFVYAIACCVLRPQTDNRLTAGAIEVGGIPQRTLAVVAASSLWTRVTCPNFPVRVNSDVSA